MVNHSFFTTIRGICFIVCYNHRLSRRKSKITFGPTAAEVGDFNFPKYLFLFLAAIGCAEVRLCWEKFWDAFGTTHI